jgi:hypothetical protein
LETKHESLSSILNDSLLCTACWNWFSYLSRIRNCEQRTHGFHLYGFNRRW